LNEDYDPVDAGTYLDALLSEYNSDTEEPDEVTSNEIPLDEPTTSEAPEESTTKKSPASSTHNYKKKHHYQLLEKTLPLAPSRMQSVKCARANISMSLPSRCCFVICVPVIRPGF
jgi:hypothetical protein